MAENAVQNSAVLLVKDAGTIPSGHESHIIPDPMALDKPSQSDAQVLFAARMKGKGADFSIYFGDPNPGNNIDAGALRPLTNEQLTRLFSSELIDRCAKRNNFRPMLAIYVELAKRFAKAGVPYEQMRAALGFQGDPKPADGGEDYIQIEREYFGVLCQITQDVHYVRQVLLKYPQWFFGEFADEQWLVDMEIDRWATDLLPEDFAKLDTTNMTAKWAAVMRALQVISLGQAPTREEFTSCIPFYDEQRNERILCGLALACSKNGNVLALRALFPLAQYMGIDLLYELKQLQHVTKDVKHNTILEWLRVSQANTSQLAMLELSECSSELLVSMLRTDPLITFGQAIDIFTELFYRNARSATVDVADIVSVAIYNQAPEEELERAISRTSLLSILTKRPQIEKNFSPIRFVRRLISGLVFDKRSTQSPTLLNFFADKQSLLQLITTFRLNYNIFAETYPGDAYAHNRADNRFPIELSSSIALEQLRRQLEVTMRASALSSEVCDQVLTSLAPIGYKKTDHAEAISALPPETFFQHVSELLNRHISPLLLQLAETLQYSTHRELPHHGQQYRTEMTPIAVQLTDGASQFMVSITYRSPDGHITRDAASIASLLNLSKKDPFQFPFTVLENLDDRRSRVVAACRAHVLNRLIFQLRSGQIEGSTRLRIEPHWPGHISPTVLIPESVEADPAYQLRLLDVLTQTDPEPGWSSGDYGLCSSGPGQKDTIFHRFNAPMTTELLRRSIKMTPDKLVKQSMGKTSPNNQKKDGGAGAGDSVETSMQITKTEADSSHSFLIQHFDQQRNHGQMVYVDAESNRVQHQNGGGDGRQQDQPDNSDSLDGQQRANIQKNPATPETNQVTNLPDEHESNIWFRTTDLISLYIKLRRAVFGPTTLRVDLKSWRNRLSFLSASRKEIVKMQADLAAAQDKELYAQLLLQKIVALVTPQHTLAGYQLRAIDIDALQLTFAQKKLVRWISLKTTHDIQGNNRLPL